MKQFKRLALLAVSVVATLGLSGVANAAPAKPDASNVATSQAAALARAESMMASPVVPAAVGPCGDNSNLISNGGSISLGVIRPGSTTKTYDALLPADGDSCHAPLNWHNVGGWYVGTGYCTVQLRSDDGGVSYRRQLPDLGPGQHRISTATSYIVRPYKGTC